MDHKIPQEVLSKLKKCIALSRGTNFEAESETAMRMAKKIMEEYGLSMADVEMSLDGHIKEDKMATVEGFAARDFWPWEKVLAVAIEYLMPVKPLLSRNKLLFIGAESDAAMASAVYKMLRTELKRISLGEMDEQHRRSFLDGCTLVMVRRAKAMQEEQKPAKKAVASTALVVVKKNDVALYFRKTYTNTRPSNSRGSERYDEAYERGKAAGAKVGLNFKTKSIAGGNQ